MSTTTLKKNERADGPSSFALFLSRRSAMIPTFAAIGIFIILMVGSQIYFANYVTPEKFFMSPGNLSSWLYDYAYLIILAVGMTFVILTGGIDLSVGSVLAFSGILVAQFVSHGVPLIVAAPIAILAGGVIGLLVGLLVRYANVQPFIASLAGLFLGRGLTFVVSTDSIRIEDPATLWFQTKWYIGNWYITPVGVIALLTVAVGAVILHLTRFGRTVYAIGGNEQSARLMGLSDKRTKVMVYVISGLCGALAGFVLVASSGQGYPRYGIGTELDAIAAVVIGGTLLAGGRGYVLGSLVGVLVFVAIRSFISFKGLEQAWNNIFVGLLVLLFIVVQRVIVARSDRAST